jgi:outer membrane protein assembly factor BamB
MSRIALLIIVCVVTAGRADDWPAFRGGARAGVADAATLPDRWDTTKNVVWSVEVPGRGWSSPVVVGDRVFLTTVISEEKVAAPKKGLYINDLRGKIPPGEHRWVVLCVDFKSGKPLWEKEVHKGKPPSAVHIKNSYASETPVADGKHVYAVFGNVGVFCLDHAGKLVWSKTLEPRPTQMNWGPAASPALYRDRLFLVRDNEEKSELIGLEAETGKELWRVERKGEKSNWATPFVWENPQRIELVTAGKGKVRSYDLDGKLLWELGGMSMIAIPTPFAAHGLLYVTSGYVMDPSRPLFAVRPGAPGDITLAEGDTSSKHIAWCLRTAGPYHPTPLVYGDYLYVLYDRGMLSCYDARTGKPVYEKNRLQGGGAFTSSPWAYHGKVFCLSEDGDTFVVKAGKEFELLGKNRLDEMTLATPALAGGSLVLRTMNRIYRIEK